MQGKCFPKWYRIATVGNREKENGLKSSFLSSFESDFNYDFQQTGNLNKNPTVEARIIWEARGAYTMITKKVISIKEILKMIKDFDEKNS